MDRVLVGDIGGTNIRFAIASLSKGKTIVLEKTERHALANFENFNEAVDRYVTKIGEAPSRAAFALAGPKFDDNVHMTNAPWIVSEADLQDRFGFAAVHLMNDFVGMARGALAIPDDGFQRILPGKLNYKNPVVCLGPGTGLGMSIIAPDHIGHRIIATEGGHMTFAAQTEVERAIIDILERDIPFISYETVLSGPGFLRIYLALCEIRNCKVRCDEADEIIGEAQANPGGAADQAIDVFLGALGNLCATAAVGTGAQSGGIILGGGVSRHMAPFFASSSFEARFRERGSSSWFVKDTPVQLIMHHYTALYGAASAALSDIKERA